MQTKVFDLAIIGGGTAALAAVSEALDQGVTTIALIEKREHLGGECALNACVPLHTIAKAAWLMREITQNAQPYGLDVPQYSLNFSQLMKKVNAVVQEGLENSYAADERVTVLHGTASFISKREIQVDDTVIRADKIIVATGAVPCVPDIPGLKEAGFLLYPQATHLETCPPTWTIIGGGRIGVEFAQIFNALGMRVNLIEKQSRLLPRMEPEISLTLEALLRQEGIRLYTECDIHHIQTTGEYKQTHLITGPVLDSHVILVATGRRGNVNGLNLEAAGIAYDESGIQVNDELQTSSENIWAVGDVVGPYRFTHVANYQAVVAVQNAIKSIGKKVNYQSIPLVIYTEPSIAHIGLSETESNQKHLSVITLKIKANEPTRFRVESQEEGFIKVIVDAETDQIVGGHIFADQAGEMIHLLALAMENSIPVASITKMVYAYPTRMQLVQKVLEPYPREKAKLIEFGKMLT
jgi:pyruvate/2-oxoglutarate dehydrogenase complex dihydrolipoamide dehydrogenase (E3) component